jgi:phosphonate transport system permease protein
VSHTAPYADPAWRSRLTWALLFVLLLLPSIYFSEANPMSLLGADSWRASKLFLQSFYPPKLDAEFLTLVLAASWKTVAIATVGVSMAIALAIPLALLAVNTLSISAVGKPMSPLSRAVRAVVRSICVLLRSVPEIVWALIFVRAVGLGDSAGVAAIALSYAGMLAKVYVDIIESNDRSAGRALLANGASRASSLLYGTLPTCALELVSYTVYRWECAIRASVVMGFVGAGGLGQQMELSMRMLAGGEVVVMLAAFVGLTALADLLSAQVRKALA